VAANIIKARDQVADYGYLIDDAGELHKPNAPRSGVYISSKGNRFYAKARHGDDLWSGPDLSVFLEKFWFAKKLEAPVKWRTPVMSNTEREELDQRRRQLRGPHVSRPRNERMFAALEPRARAAAVPRPKREYILPAPVSDPFTTMAQRGSVPDAFLIANAFTSSHSEDEVYACLRFTRAIDLSHNNLSGYFDGPMFEGHFNARTQKFRDFRELQALAFQYLDNL
jgi:hypothetical protein